jgi:polar amino acid transport system ATP-binding protein
MAANSSGATPLLRIRGVQKSFGATHVLRGIDLDVARGEVVSIIGPSGGGKMTLLRCVNFLEIYDEGSIAIDGAEVGYRDGDARKRCAEGDLVCMRAEIGMVF